MVPSIDCIVVPEQGQATDMNGDVLFRLVTNIFRLFLWWMMQHKHQLIALTREPLLKGRDQYILIKNALCKKERKYLFSTKSS
jgi:hypothetical protein